MRILALDLGRSIGWAYRDLDVVDSGAWWLGSAGEKRWQRLWGHLELVRLTYGIPELVVYERPGRLFGHAKKFLPGLQAIIEFWAERNFVEWVAMSPNTTKKHATGKGRADKEQMISAAKARWPEARWTRCASQLDDQCDALWLLDACVSAHK